MRRRNLKYLKEKKIINLKKSHDDIFTAIKNQGYVELPKPIHHGYNATFVLRDDILNRNDVGVYQEALDACNHVIWHRNESFRVRNYRNRIWYDYKPTLKTIDKNAYDRLSLRAKSFFRECNMYEFKYWNIGFKNNHYFCTFTYELEIKITRHFITHRREHDSILYQREAEIEKELYNMTNGYPWGNWRSSRYWDRTEVKKLKLKINRGLVEVLKTYKGINTLNDVLDLKGNIYIKM